MATQPDDDGQDLDNTDIDGNDTGAGTDQDAADDGDDQGDDDTLELTVEFTGENDPDADKPDDSSVIRALRQKARDQAKELADLRKATVVQPKPLRPEPDFDADGEKYGWDHNEWKTDWQAWNAEKAEADRQTQDAQKGADEANQAWLQDLTAYREKIVQFAAPDYDDAEEAVKTDLDAVQQAVIVKAARDPAAMVYALGKSDAKRAELAKIKDPIKLAAEIARMEAGVKITRGKKPAAIDRPASGSASMPGGTDKQMEKLTKEADRTGNRTALIKYKREKGL